MPPRKSNVSQVTTTGDEGTPSKERDGINIEDLSLPRTMVQRLAKGVLPPNTQIQKDAITAISKAATVFVNYLSQAANTSTIPTSRKTISPDAVLDALTELEFETFLPRVQAELKKFNEVQTGKRNEYRRKLKEKEIQNGGDKVGANGIGAAGRADGEEDEEEGGIDGSEERAKKRVRRESGVRLEASIGGSKNRVEVNGDDEQENILAENGPDDEEDVEEDGDGDGTEEEDEEESSQDEGDAGGGEEVDSADLEERGRTGSLTSGEEDEESE